jgi:nitrate reductase NapE component
MLLAGEHQDGRIIFIILVSSIAFSGYILWMFSLTLNAIFTAILAFDIMAGLFSNLQPQTNQAWKKQPLLSRQIFIIFHLTLYPLLVVLFQLSLPLMVLMLVLLITKTTAFVVGISK